MDQWSETTWVGWVKRQPRRKFGTNLNAGNESYPKITCNFQSSWHTLHSIMICERHNIYLYPCPNQPLRKKHITPIWYILKHSSWLSAYKHSYMRGILLHQHNTLCNAVSTYLITEWSNHTPFRWALVTNSVGDNLPSPAIHSPQAYIRIFRDILEASKSWLNLKYT